MRVATFNILHGQSLSDGVVDAGRLRDAVGELDADVLGLQEVDRAQPRSGSADLAAEAATAIGGGVVYRYVPALIGTPGATWRAAADPGDAHNPEDADASFSVDGSADPSYGVALFSRLPVRSWHVVRLPPAPVSSPVAVPGSTRRFILLRDEPRILLAATVDTPAGTMTIATTHLSFVPGWNVWQLRTALRALRALPSPRVLMGDLNLPGQLPTLLSGWRAFVYAPTYPAPAPRWQFDHVLGQGGLPRVQAAHVRALEVSDHCAVSVDFVE